MADKGTFKLMAKEGVIWGLSSLALLDHFELSQMCAQALCRYVWWYIVLVVLLLYLYVWWLGLFLLWFFVVIILSYCRYS